MNGRSSWSWVGPALIAGLILLPTVQFGDRWPWWVGGVGWLAGLVFGGWALINLVFYVGDWWLDAWKDVMDKLYRNSPAGQAEAIKNLRTDQIRLLMQNMGGALGVKLSPDETEGPQFLVVGCDLPVPVEFLKFVMDNSDDDCWYPQNRFNDQAYSWDPLFRKYTDRDFYKSLQSWAFGLGAIEWPRGNQAARWKEGWSPKRMKESMVLDAFSYSEKPADRAAPLAIPQMDVGMQQGSGAYVRTASK